MKHEKEKEATLADLAIRETYDRKTKVSLMTNRPLHDLRMAIVQARKFVLDDSMSAFMADLSTVPIESVKAERRGEVMDALRHGAKLPHAKTWIEFSEHAFRARLLEIKPGAKDLLGKSLQSADIPKRMGWLLEQHPQVPSVVRMTEFIELSDTVSSLAEARASILPYSIIWNSEDNPMPWHCDTHAGMIAHGVTGFYSPYIGVSWNDVLKGKYKVIVQWNNTEFPVHALLVEFAGAVRYAIAFLATLNDVPVLRREVRPSKGYMAKGNYRKFVEHSVISIKVPQRTSYETLARKLVAIARKRAHMVRGHWRNFLPVGKEVTCIDLELAHLWSSTDSEGRATCQNCSTRRTWIKEHQRGDASLGFVTHDYSVQHGGDHARR